MQKIKEVDKDKAQEILNIIYPFKERAKEEYGVNWVYAADELFLLSDMEIPKRGYYNDFVQIENGIGIARKFLDSANISYTRLKDRLDKKKSVYVITSVLGEKVILKIKEKTDLNIISVAVENEFFGRTVTVSGLMTFNDIKRKIRKLKKNISILIPGIIFNNDGITLDGYTKKQVKQSDPRIVLTGNKGRDIIRSFRRENG
ncbi:MAG: hypothetical protein C0601_03255 [Candidatus Muiribacterium halophilum]|uniref:DUF512 domain-containing protein n=1 Tax=Muiribacterium halophilum TaxID=2053465 RepID=A0A2N5ZJR4_MUIH1|nr:MAG: hypothetical protein C0601_03255 [Candidatus Muirbacterium halophilum]